jgi:CDP-diacylglycerol--serine O-phosphatidyltransferase
MLLAVQQDLNRAAILLILGLITDRLDGLAARHLAVESEFGYRFDCFTDYLFYVVAPTLLAFRLAGSPGHGLVIPALLLPLLSAAIRYARNIGWGRTESFDRLGFRGLPTLIYAFYIVALVFLDREVAIARSVFPQLFTLTAPVFAALMLAPARYPKLARHAWFLVPVVAGLNVMPFYLTEPLAWATLGLGSAYVIAAPLLPRAREERCPSDQRA